MYTARTSLFGYGGESELKRGFSEEANGKGKSNQKYFIV